MLVLTILRADASPLDSEADARTTRGHASAPEAARWLLCPTDPPPTAAERTLTLLENDPEWEGAPFDPPENAE